MLFAYDIPFQGNWSDMLWLSVWIDECLYYEVWWGPLAVKLGLLCYTYTPTAPPVMVDSWEDWSNPDSLFDNWSLNLINFDGGQDLYKDPTIKDGELVMKLSSNCQFWK